MAKSVILDVLEHTIGKYVLNLDASALNVSLLWCAPFCHLSLYEMCECSQEYTCTSSYVPYS